MTLFESSGVILLGAALLTTTSPVMSASTPTACPVTHPNGSEPPVKHFGGKAEYSAEYRGPRSDRVEGSHGNGKLWVILYPEGKVIFAPGGAGFLLPDGSLSMKFMWWRGVQGKLTIEGKRLDAPASPLRASIPEGYGDKGFQATALIFPTVGCWEVTGQVGAASLTFVTLVVKQERK